VTTNALHILILEDNSDDFELITYQLRKSDLIFEIERTDNEQDYVTALSTKTFDLILSDYTMSGFNALRALEILQERALDIPFLVATGTTSEEAAVECIKRGAVDYLLKDRLARLVPAIKMALADKKIRQEKQQAEIAVQRSEQRFRALIENAVDYFVILDPDGTIQYSSPSAGRKLGYHWDEAQEQGAVSFIHPDDVNRFGETIAKAVEQPGVAQPMIELRVRRKDGGWIVVETVITSLLDDPAIQGIVINSHDVTERRLAEDARQSVEERLRAIIASLPVIVFAFDRNEILTLIEGNGVSAFGLNAEDITGKTVNEVYRNGLQIVENYQRALAGESFVTQIEIPNGPTFEIYYSALRDRNGEATGAIGVAIDITERRMAEEALRTAEVLQVRLEKERELNHLKSRFVSLVSHEFRTPLTTIMSSSSMLKTYADRLTPERRDDHIHNIQTQVKRLTELLDDVLAIGKGETVGMEIHPEPVILVELCQQIVREYQRLPSQGHQIHFSYQMQCPVISADPKLLRQAFSNLLSNAIKYSPQGGNIYFDLACDSLRAVIQIRDEGIGIPPEEVNRLFEEFIRASNVGDIQGTGLGLAIVRNAIYAHGGTVTLESELGKGTTFTIELPVIRED
jgi:PAS domain S-box-containing protein